jgi:sigma-E factor negative regulatory protein RseA
MSIEPRENLSSFMDGEVDKSAAAFLVRRLANDTALRATWDRFHMIRDCLRQQESNVVEADLCARVREAIDREDSTREVRKSPMSWFKPVAGVAVAASVAFVAVLMVGPGQQAVIEGPAQGESVTALAEPFVSPNMGNPLPASQPVNLAGQRTTEQEKAKAYLLRHYQVSGDSAGQGFIALVPIVATSNSGTDTEDPEKDLSDQDADIPRQ